MKYYWTSFWSVFFRIKTYPKIYSDRGLPAFIKLITTGGNGINPTTGFFSGLGFDRLLPVTEQLSSKEKRVVAFYCKEDKYWWISTSSGYDWMLVPSQTTFLKILHLVDIVL